MSDEKSANIIGKNLFGEPVYSSSKTRGRPAFEWTEKNSHKVSMLLAMGWTNARIASVIQDPRTGKSISEPTLKRYFRSELKVRDHARDMLNTSMLMIAYEKSCEGNVGAMRHFEKLVEKNDAVLADARLRGTSQKKDEKPKKPLGKKELERQQAHETIDDPNQGGWNGLLKPGFGGSVN